MRRGWGGWRQVGLWSGSSKPCWPPVLKLSAASRSQDCGNAGLRPGALGHGAPAWCPVTAHVADGWARRRVSAPTLEHPPTTLECHAEHWQATWLHSAFTITQKPANAGVIDLEQPASGMPKGANPCRQRNRTWMPSAFTILQNLPMRAFLSTIAPLMCVPLPTPSGRQSCGVVQRHAGARVSWQATCRMAKAHGRAQLSLAT